ncbi:Acyl-coenzyme A oxidase 3, peroxisomal [Cardamine amara subsp. amara]|uniref:Acyl-coenzyme A oxidase 3, peroxisomal n=1 Tax=Cardamine amara subsp. amara TaxID=228776 RepID=A0ABD0ZQR3_CARAN
MFQLIKDPDQRFGAFMAPLTSRRVTIASSAIYSAKVGLAIAIRYSLSRRAFSLTARGPEVLLLDYPSHQRRYNRNGSREEDPPATVPSFTQKETEVS